jgi:membrane protein CcdC involved in cytochrome C biogenesis
MALEYFFPYFIKGSGGFLFYTLVASVIFSPFLWFQESELKEKNTHLSKENHFYRVLFRLLMITIPLTAVIWVYLSLLFETVHVYH